MKQRLIAATLLVVGTCCLPARGQNLQAQGFVEGPSGIDGCLQEYTYFLTDLCTGEGVRLSTSPGALSGALCEWIEVAGPDVGIECTIIEVQEGALADPPCSVEVKRLTVEPHSANTTRIRWSDLPCANDYDVIRGSVSLLAAGSLGPVTCVADDEAGLLADDMSGLDPAPGEALFYLVRGDGALGSAHYGWSSAGDPRLPASGDCSPP
jgi:hypothetical protein